MANSSPAPAAGRPIAERPRALIAGRERIIALQVTLADGTTHSWAGTGSVSVEHTSSHHSLLKPNDVHYIEAILRFTPDEAQRSAATGSFPETAGVDPHSIRAVQADQGGAR